MCVLFVVVLSAKVRILDQTELIVLRFIMCPDVMISPLSAAVAGFILYLVATVDSSENVTRNGTLSSTSTPSTTTTISSTTTAQNSSIAQQESNSSIVQQNNGNATQGLSATGPFVGIDNGMLARTFYVMIACTVLLVIYFVVRAYRYDTTNVQLVLDNSHQHKSGISITSQLLHKGKIILRGGNVFARLFVGCVAIENRENTGLLQVVTGKNWHLWTETMTMTTMLRFTRLVVESDAPSLYIVVYSVHVFGRKFDVDLQTSQCSR